MSLAIAPQSDVKKEIVSCFWRRPRDEIDLEDYVSYFQFYHKSCEALYLGLHNEAKSLVADNHRHVLIIIEALWEFIDHSLPCTRPTVRLEAEKKLSSIAEGDSITEIRLNNSINLALRLWLTLDIRNSAFAPAASTIQWDDNTTLHEFVRSQFLGPRASRNPTEKDEKETVISDGELTAVKLRRIGGITIEWTYHLNQHLRFDREFRRLKIYSLKTCLHDQRLWYVVLSKSLFEYTEMNELILESLVKQILFPTLSSTRQFSR